MVGIFIQQIDNPSNKVALNQIGGDITKPVFGSIGASNARFSDATTLLDACSRALPGTNKNVLLVYRGVAIGGLQRNLGGFTSKPLTVKNKSIDPAVINDAGSGGLLNRLTGLVPIQMKFGKGGTDGVIVPAAGQHAYQVIMVDSSVGNTTTYLCCTTVKGDRTLSWEAAPPNASSGKELLTFLGDSNPYLADWDLVIVGVQTSDRTDKAFNVVSVAGRGTLPQWLLSVIGNQTVGDHVTQHGPESLYCGNAINSSGEEFLIVYGGAGNCVSTVVNSASLQAGATPFAKLMTFLQSLNYKFYAFSDFKGDGSGTADTVEAFNARFCVKDA